MKLVSAKEAVAAIRSHDTLYVHCAAAVPNVLLHALVERAPELSGVTVVHLHIDGDAPHLAPGLEKSFRHKALFIGPNARAAVNEGRAEYIPVFLSDVPSLFRRGTIPLDAVFVNVSAPDAHGFCSLGTSCEAMLAAIASAKVIVAQINRAMPRVLGDGFVHVDDIHFGVDVNERPFAHEEPELTDVERRIGGHVADLVPDEATLQMGIGAIPSAVATFLTSKKNLGVHTEMFTDAVMTLVQSGAVTGAAKEVNRGKIVSGFLMGTQKLYDFVHDNPMIEMRPVDYTNDSTLIRRFRKMVAINSAIEVDLSGQVCADSIGSRLYSGVGGQMDFIRGAAMAERGRAIIALPSTASDGKVSRITPFLREGAGVVTTRAHVHTVVTEWGVAELHGRSIAERARALIAIAHPDHRDALTKRARLTHYL